MSLMIQSNATRSREDLRTNRLPRRIISPTAGIILIFVVTLGAFMISMAWALDVHASEQSVVQIRDTQNKLPDQITLASFDWAKWALGATEINAGNIGRLNENLGSTVAAGQVMQLAVIWGGRYAINYCWLSSLSRPSAWMSP